MTWYMLLLHRNMSKNEDVTDLVFFLSKLHCIPFIVLGIQHWKEDTLHKV